jgi:hypothetical protein
MTSSTWGIPFALTRLARAGPAHSWINFKGQPNLIKANGSILRRLFRTSSWFGIPIPWFSRGRALQTR